MQNRVILEGLIGELRRNSFTVFFPSIIPANDGSIALGQTVIANKRK
jgi:hydrogenase maturation factor HypF (carbamoyltransferase family)